jgi:hypothetical protein
MKKNFAISVPVHTQVQQPSLVSPIHQKHQQAYQHFTFHLYKTHSNKTIKSKLGKYKMKTHIMACKKHLSDNNSKAKAGTMNFKAVLTKGCVKTFTPPFQRPIIKLPIKGNKRRNRISEYTSKFSCFKKDG